MTKSKFFTWFTIVLLLVLAGLFYFKFYFPVASDAVKSGELNQLMYKGYIWKTYEGKLIQAGFKSKNGGSGVQSNEFDFSIEDADLAKELMKHSGKVVSLRYKQYNGWLPWRGMQRNIVYAIDNVEPRQGYGVNDDVVNAVAADSGTNLPYDN